MRAGPGAATACGTSAGISTMLPGVGCETEPPMVSVNERSRTMTNASRARCVRSHKALAQARADGGAARLGDRP
jgi:hypothetical protein